MQCSEVRVNMRSLVIASTLINAHYYTSKMALFLQSINKHQNYREIILPELFNKTTEDVKNNFAYTKYMDSLNKYLVYCFVRRKNVRIQKILGKGKRLKFFKTYNI